MTLSQATAITLSLLLTRLCLALKVKTAPEAPLLVWEGEAPVLSCYVALAGEPQWTRAVRSLGLGRDRLTGDIPIDRVWSPNSGESWSSRKLEILNGRPTFLQKLFENSVSEDRFHFPIRKQTGHDVPLDPSLGGENDLDLRTLNDLYLLKPSTEIGQSVIQKVLGQNHSTFPEEGSDFHSGELRPLNIEEPQDFGAAERQKSPGRSILTKHHGLAGRRIALYQHLMSRSAGRMRRNAASAQNATDGMSDDPTDHLDASNREKLNYNSDVTDRNASMEIVDEEDDLSHNVKNGSQTPNTTEGFVVSEGRLGSTVKPQDKLITINLRELQDEGNVPGLINGSGFASNFSKEELSSKNQGSQLVQTTEKIPRVIESPQNTTRSDVSTSNRNVRKGPTAFIVQWFLVTSNGVSREIARRDRRGQVKVLKEFRKRWNVEWDSRRPTLSLLLPRLQLHDGGTFRCAAVQGSARKGVNASSDVHVKVIPHPAPMTTNPVVMTTPEVSTSEPSQSPTLSQPVLNSTSSKAVEVAPSPTLSQGIHQHHAEVFWLALGVCCLGALSSLIFLLYVVCYRHSRKHHRTQPGAKPHHDCKCRQLRSCGASCGEQHSFIHTRTNSLMLIGNFQNKSPAEKEMRQSEAPRVQAYTEHEHEASKEQTAEYSGPTELHYADLDLPSAHNQYHHIAASTVYAQLAFAKPS
uniref:uncharacterized protein isoform X2 n=1 Tax=Myxine glutinosa TaxID=7769 RepID=UPI00358E3BB5